MSLIGTEPGTNRRKPNDELGAEEAADFVSRECQHHAIKLAKGREFVDLAKLDRALEVAHRHGMHLQARELERIRASATA